jgi:hypothetical protein
MTLVAQALVFYLATLYMWKASELVKFVDPINRTSYASFAKYFPLAARKKYVCPLL